MVAALAIYEQALGLYRAVGDRLGEANTLAAQGQVALMHGDQVTADQLLDQAIGIYHKIGDRYSVAAKIGNYGWVLRRIGRYGDAQPYLQRAADLFADMGLSDYAASHRQAANESAPQTAEQQIAAIIEQAETAVAEARADPTNDRAALATQLDEVAKQAEEGEKEGSPYLALAARLRSLAARLSEAEGDQP